MTQFKPLDRSRNKIVNEIFGYFMALSPKTRTERDYNEKLLNGFRAYLKEGRITPEILAALQADSDTAGGFLVVPESISEEFISTQNETDLIRQLANTIILFEAISLGVPEVIHSSNVDWTPEIQSVQEDTTFSFKKRKLYPHQLAKLVKVSEGLIRKSAKPVDEVVMDEFLYIFGLTEEIAFLTGNGVGKPLGVFTASEHGITTSRDVSTHNTTTAIKSDNLIANKYNIKSRYRKNATWLFSDTAMENISKLKDGDGNYIWRQAFEPGTPDTLLNKPVAESDQVPSTFTAGQYVGLFGDFQYYWIVDAIGLEIQRMKEKYILTNQIGFIGTKETDGMPVLEEAFTRVQLASS